MRIIWLGICVLWWNCTIMIGQFAIFCHNAHGKCLLIKSKNRKELILFIACIRLNNKTCQNIAVGLHEAHVDMID